METFKFGSLLTVKKLPLMQLITVEIESFNMKFEVTLISPN